MRAIERFVQFCGTGTRGLYGRTERRVEPVHQATATPRGIVARVAENPWGPWSAPQTIFNAERDGAFCTFIHRPVTASLPACDNLGVADRPTEGGATYGPYLISRFTTGDAATGTTTFYHIVDTWLPYTQVIMKATIRIQK